MRAQHHDFSLRPVTRKRPATSLLRLLVVATMAAATVVATAGMTSAKTTPSAAPVHLPMSAAPAAGQTNLGQNVLVFDPSMPTSEIQAAVDAVATIQIPNQFGTQRYSLLFKPGVYGSVDTPLIFQVGYYTEVAGLGVSPTDVTINGHIDVYNQCTTNPDGSQSCFALNNFWRSLSNLTINVTGLAGCRGSGDFWAVSQASPMRRVHIIGANLTLMDYCTAGPQYASGGFIADSQTGFVINGSQQQFFVRNSSIGGWSNGVWNQVFAGVTGAPAQAFPANNPYTTLAQNPVSREKPYLYVNSAGAYRVFVPATLRNSSGTTWATASTPGYSLPISAFYVTQPGDTATIINAALRRGKNLLITPGVYDIDQTLKIKRANTIVLGMGVATLTAQGGVTVMSVDRVPGVDIAGLMFDAGPVNSPVLLSVGQHNDKVSSRDDLKKSDPLNPTALQDVFFRIGGAHAGKATVSLTVNANNVVLDDIWAWRADHGDGVGWTENTADTGVIVNGSNVLATGLFVEHYQKYNVIWQGENGKTIFFQNEMPYDAPNQAAWQHDGVLGYAAYKVAASVKVHQAWGVGSYIYTNVDPTLHATQAFEVPITPGVAMHDLLTVSLNMAGTIDHVINGVGDPVTPSFAGPSFIVDYPALP